MKKNQTSILIPTYNCGSFLLECIGSILRQNYTDYEIVIIDDYSTDDTEKIIEGIKKTTNRILYYKNLNKKGLVYALNFGISKCNGEYIARMDADDQMLGNRLQEQIDFLENNREYIGVTSSMQLVDIAGLYLSDKLLESDDILNHFMLLFCNVFIHGSMTLRKEVLVKNFYSESFMYCEDYELWSRLIKIGKIKTLKSIHHLYRIYDSSSKTQETIRIQRSNVLKLYSHMLCYYGIEFNESDLLLHYSLFGENNYLINKESVKIWLDKVFKSSNLIRDFELDFLNYQKKSMQRIFNITD